MVRTMLKSTVRGATAIRPDLVDTAPATADRR
jgi:hypothetical protein